jgi:hypothetical protein
MIKPALDALLMATIGTPPLFAKGSDATFRAAITLTTITGPTDDENRVACAASSLPKNNLVLLRHPGCQVGLDKDDSSWQGRSIRVPNLMGCLLRGCQAGISPLERWDPRVVLHLYKKT